MLDCRVNPLNLSVKMLFFSIESETTRNPSRFGQESMVTDITDNLFRRWGHMVFGALLPIDSLMTRVKRFERINFVRFEMATPEHQSYGRKSSAPIIFIIIIIFVLAFLGYKYFTAQKVEQDFQKNLMKESIAAETQLKVIGNFFNLRMWFASVATLEEAYYSEHDSYVPPQEIPKEIYNSIELDAFASAMSKTMQEEGVELADFIQEEQFKNYIADTFGENLDNTVNALDPTKFSYEFQLAEDKQNYTLTVHEQGDINLDGDSEDAFIYSTKVDTAGIFFENEGTQEDIQTFLDKYMSLLGDSM